MGWFDRFGHYDSQLELLWQVSRLLDTFGPILKFLLIMFSWLRASWLRASWLRASWLLPSFLAMGSLLLLRRWRQINLFQWLGVSGQCSASPKIKISEISKKGVRVCWHFSLNCRAVLRESWIPGLRLPESKFPARFNDGKHFPATIREKGLKVPNISPLEMRKKAGYIIFFVYIFSRTVGSWALLILNSKF